MHPTMIPTPPRAGQRRRCAQRDLHSWRGAWLYDVLWAGGGPDADRDRGDGRHPAKSRAIAQSGGDARAAMRWAIRLASIKRARVKPMDGVVCEYYLRFRPKISRACSARSRRCWAATEFRSRRSFSRGAAWSETVPVIMRTSRGSRAQPEPRAGAESSAANWSSRRPPSFGLRSGSDAMARGATERHRGGVPARLTRWPGLIEHYRRFLPVTRRTPVVTLNEGNTPLIESIPSWPSGSAKHKGLLEVRGRSTRPAPSRIAG